MEIKELLKLINKYKWLLILVPLAAVTVTYFLVQNLPKQYRSNVQISTGLLDPTKRVISNETIDFFKVNQQFNGIIEKLNMKRNMNILSYNLIIHDLEQPQKRFKPYCKKVDSLSQLEKQELINLYKIKLATQSILTLEDDQGKYKLYTIILESGYSEAAIRKNMEISHADNSDLINIYFTSENPALSVYVVNTLAEGFITNYTADVNINETNSNALLDSLVKTKKAIMDAKTGALSAFKKSNGVLNLSEQAAAVDAQITKYESQRADVLSKIDQDEAALSTINLKLRSSGSDMSEGSRVDNRELVRLTNQLQTVNSNLTNNNNYAANRKKSDSLQTLLNEKRNQYSNDNVLDPKVSRQSLVTLKNSLEIALPQEIASLKTINSELVKLKAQFKSMVPYDADIQNYTNAAELATKEYTSAFDAYNSSKNLQNLNGFHLKIEQLGILGAAEPSKRLLYIAGAGIGSFVICIGFIMLLFFLDHSINSLPQLERATKSKVIGALNTIKGNERYIREIWNDKTGNKNFEAYRDLLRALRFEIGNKLNADDMKILGITSLGSGEGKTLFAYGLTYAFAMTGKKILLIADEVPLVSSSGKEVAKIQNFETFLIKKQIVTEDMITVLNKNMVQSSLLESQDIKSLQSGFEALRAIFDIIIIDVNSLQNTNLAKEWLLFTEKNVVVFECGKALSETDKENIKYIKNKPGFIGWIMNKMDIRS